MLMNLLPPPTTIEVRELVHGGAREWAEIDYAKHRALHRRQVAGHE
jgi:hypothetical protein